jgi:NADH-quinone oxidoreductase subunit E
VSLTDQAQEILARYPPDRSRSAVMPLLRLAQERDGWVTPEAITEIGSILGLSSAEVLAVASFYSMYHLKPKGRHVISVCHNLACNLMGAERVIEHLEDTLGVGSEGETTVDGAFTLERAECLAACDSAPCLQVDYDALHAKITPESVEALVEELRA